MTTITTCMICHGVSNSVCCARRKNPPRVPAAGFLPTLWIPPAFPHPSTEPPTRARFPKLFLSDRCLAWRAHFFLWYCSQAKRDSYNYTLTGDEWEELHNQLHKDTRCYIMKMQQIKPLGKNNIKPIWRLQGEQTYLLLCKLKYSSSRALSYHGQLYRKNEIISLWH